MPPLPSLLDPSGDATTLIAPEPSSFLLAGSQARPLPPPTPPPGEEDEETGGADPLIGFVVAGRYRILERIGRGGMGIVYQAQHLQLGKLVALKLLAGALAQRADMARRFEREAALASRLSHPNTVHVFDYGVSDGLTWLVMEIVPGSSLAQLLRGGRRVGPAWAAWVGAQVCSSLAEAHALGIVHRDIKPGNVMVGHGPGGDETVKVLDFGLAKLRHGPETNDVSGRDLILGTPAYMAPEQIQGEPVDARTDVYALGAMLYRMLSGEPLFRRARGFWQMLASQLAERPEPLNQRFPGLDIPPSLDAVVMRALAKNPDDRFRDVWEMRAALLDAVAESPWQDDRPSLPLPLVEPLHATRDEVAAYERGLRRQVVLSRVLAASVLLGTAFLLGLLALASLPVWTELASSSPATLSALPERHP